MSAAALSGIEHHLLYHRSVLDGTDQPCLVSAPTGAIERAILIFFLHDGLAEPTSAAFVEEAFREASRWRAKLEQGPPAVFAQPYGRGNAGWIGPGGRDLFDLWETLAARFPVSPEKARLIGLGMGGTAALLLASWFPHRFEAVVARGAWSDERQGPLIGVEPPAWERPQRRALSPRLLARNLAGTPLWLDHPWWRHGMCKTASRSHFNRLRAELRRRGVEVTTPAAVDGALARRQALAESECLEWLLRPHPQSPLTERFRCPTARASIARGLFIDPTDAPATATVRARWKSSSVSLKTRRVREIALEPGDDRVVQVSLDKQTIEHPVQCPARFERLARRWLPMEKELGCPPEEVAGDAIVKSRGLGGPVMDLFWDRVILSPGTLGEQSDNERMAALARELQTAWSVDLGGLQPYPGVQGVDLSFEIKSDAELAREALPSAHLVCIGRPGLHLLMARWQNQLAAQWMPDDQRSSAMGVRLGSRVFRERLDALVLLAPHPEVAGKYLLVIAPNDTESLGSVARLNVPLLPDVTLLRDGRVARWGYFDVDWRTLRW